MNEEHRKLLRSNTRFITSDLVVKGEFVDYLYEKGTLTKDMVEEIEAERTRREKASSFLGIITRRGPNAFQMFLEALLESGQEHIARALDEDFVEMYQNRSTDFEKEELKNFNRSVGHEELAPSDIAKVHPVEPPAPIPNYFESYNKDKVNSSGDSLKTEGVQRGSVGSIDSGNADLEVKLTNVDETDLQIRGLLSDTENVYRMNSKPRGLAVIFSNELFLTKFRNREGNAFDLRNLKILFNDLGFIVREYSEQTAMNMRSYIKQLSMDPTHKDSCAFILCCLSHGAQGKIFGVDADHLDIQRDIIDPFDGNNCEDLRGKPKVFIFQACQGRESTRGVPRHDGPLDDTSEVDAVSVALNTLEVGDRQRPAENPGNNSHVHEKADIFQIYATVEGYKAWRHPEIGSWFVRAIVLVFQEYCHKEHLLDMFQRVGQQVSKLQTGYNVQKNEGYFVQQPSFRGSGNKRLYFFPGYYDI